MSYHLAIYYTLFCFLRWFSDVLEGKKATHYLSFFYRSRVSPLTLCLLKWLSSLLQDLHIKVTCSIFLHYDNQAKLHIASNPVFHECTKHIEIDYHFNRDAFRAGFISPHYLRSKLQSADILTKALHPILFHSSVRKLHIFLSSSPT